MQLPTLSLRPQQQDLPPVELPFPLGSPADLRGVWRIQGIAGSGKTSILAQTVATALKLGVPAREILVLTPNKESASLLNQQIGLRLRGTHFIGEANFAYSVHAVAFGLLRNAIQRDPSLPFDPDIRLISGPEQDVVIRQLLQEMAEDPEAVLSWPAEVQNALTYAGFARELRDFMLRSYERGIGSQDLADIADDVQDPLWAAIAGFMQRYEEISSLAGVDTLSASELVSTVVQLDLPEPQWKYILVDDAQHLDPKSAELIERLQQHAHFSVVCGDVEQTIFQFRGASSQWFENLKCNHEVQLNTSHRIAQVTRRIAPNQQRHDDAVADVLRRTHLSEQVAWKDMAVIVRSASAIPALRRQLLAAGVPVYTDGTAIVLAEEPIVKELLATIDTWKSLRAYAQAWRELPLTDTNAVIADASASKDDADDADDADFEDPAALIAAEAKRRAAYAALEQLITGQLAVLEPLEWQRLERSLRRICRTIGLPFTAAGNPAWDAVILLLDAADLAAAAKSKAPSLELGIVPEFSVASSRAELEQQLYEAIQTGLSDSQLADLARLQAIVQAPRAAAGVEQTLWQIWQKAGIARSLQNLSIHGGPIGAQADRTLDAAMALFDIAANWVERRPGGSAASFQRYLREQELPAGVRERSSSERDAVRLVTAHGVSGMQWHTVVLAQVQDHLWPALDPSGSLLKQEAFIDYVDQGIAPDTYISRTADQLQAEQNLFHVALTRATHKVVVLAVEDEEAHVPQVPSRFLQHLHPAETELDLAHLEAIHQAEVDYNQQADGLMARVLSPANIVAELRRALETSTDEKVRTQALRQLARLAQAGVPGAHPEHWWGKDASTTQPLSIDRLSPSKVEKALGCPLRAALESNLPSDNTEAMLQGNLVHLVAEFVAQGLAHVPAVAAATAAYAQCLELPGAWRASAIKAYRKVLDTLVVWLSHHKEKHPLVEVPVSVDLQQPDGDSLKISGRIDRLLREGNSYTIVDYKTSQKPTSVAEAQANPQLRTYQVALSQAALRDGEIVSSQPPELRVQEAKLVYVAKQSRGKATERIQSELQPEQRAEFQKQLFAVQHRMQAIRIAATPSKEACEHCALMHMCPAKEEGKSLIS